MAQDNVSTVMRLYDAWGRGEFLGPAGLLDAEVEYVNPEGAIEPGTRRGLEAFAAAVDKLLEGWASWEMEPEQYTPVGDKVAVVVRYRATARASGVQVEGRESALVTVRDGSDRALRVVSRPRRRAQGRRGGGLAVARRPPSAGNVRPIITQHLFAGIPVTDRDAAVRWYERLFGRPPDLVPNDREAAWQLTDSGWICLYDEGEGGGGTAAPHTLLVSDLDAFLADVAERGIVPGPVEAIAPSVRQSVIVDPDGNRLKVGHVDESPAAGEHGVEQRQFPVIAAGADARPKQLH